LFDKRWFAIGAFLLGVFLFAVFLVPFFVNADSFRLAVENQLSGSLGREVTLGKVSFSVIGASLTAEDLAIADDPAFSKVPFIQAKALEIGLEILPFLFHREVRITRLSIDTPSIQLIEHENGSWNYSSLGLGPATRGTQQQPATASELSVGEVKITNGNALVSSIPSSKQPFVYSGLNLTLKQVGFGRTVPFEFSASLPGGGTVKATGDVGPISRDDSSNTPFRGKLELRGFDPVAAGMIDPGKGISAYNDVDGQISSDGSSTTVSGKATISRLQLSLRGSPAQEAIEIDFTILENPKTKGGTVQDIAVHSGSSTAHLSGSFQYKPEALMLDLRLSAPDLPIDQFERLLPVMGIHYPGGSSLQGGTFAANIAIVGPITGVTCAGPVEIKDTKLAGFDLGSRIEGVSGFGSTGSATAIKLMKANVSSTPDTTKITGIDVELPQVGSATGQGTVEPSGELDFRLSAKLNKLSADDAKTNSVRNSLSGRIVPVIVTGTATNPSIRVTAGSL
jgi:AsmA protein